MAESDVYWLREKDIKTIREIVRWWRRRPSRRIGPGSSGRELSQSASVYVAFTPPEGLPALDLGALPNTGTGTPLSDDVPGGGYCDVYELVDDPPDDPYFVPVGKNEYIFNIGPMVPGLTWILVVKDTFGRWLAVSGSGSGTYVVRVLQAVSGVTEYVTGTGTGTVLDDDVASSRVCEVYTITDGGLFTPRGAVVRAYNTQTRSIRANTWAVVSQDHDGRWVFVEADYVDPARGTITYVKDACLVGGDLKVTYETYDLDNDTVDLTWCVTNPDCRPECSPPITTCVCDPLPPALCVSITQQAGGSLCSGLVGHHFTAAWDEGQNGYVLNYSVGGYSISGLISCSLLSSTCAGFPSGNHWSFTGATGCPDFLPIVYQACTYENQTLVSEMCDPFLIILDLYPGTIRLTITPGPCADTGTGTGTGTGGGLGLACCPTGAPAVLYLTLVGAGDCSCLSGTYPLLWSGTEWFYQNIGLCSSDGAGVVMSISCNPDSGQWIAQVSCYDGAEVATWTWSVAGTCDFPISLGSDSPSGTVGTNCCFDSISGTISL